MRKPSAFTLCFLWLICSGFGLSFACDPVSPPLQEPKLTDAFSSDFQRLEPFQDNRASEVSIDQTVPESTPERMYEPSTDNKTSEASKPLPESPKQKEDSLKTDISVPDTQVKEPFQETEPLLEETSQEKLSPEKPDSSSQEKLSPEKPDSSPQEKLHSEGNSPDKSTFPKGSYRAVFVKMFKQRSWPVDGTSIKDIRSSFGPRVYQTGRYDFHRGIDIHAAKGSLVRAVWQGKVWKITKYTGLGHTIILEHTAPQSFAFAGITFRRFYTWYGHLHKVESKLKKGQAVKAGDLLGQVGSSGTTKVNHLHLELRLGTWCSLEYQRKNPSSKCIISHTHFDPHVHPSLILGPLQTQIQVKQLVTRHSNEQSLIQIQLPENATILNRLKFVLFAKKTQKQVRIHVMDYNLRTGFDARTTKQLDTQSKSKPYIQPLSFGPKATKFTAHWILPKAFLQGLPKGKYNATLSLTTIWKKNQTQIQWSFSL